MIVDAVHITDRHVAIGIGRRMALGQHGLLNMPAPMTVGGCFWAVMVPSSSAGVLIHQELPNPYSGRAPATPVKLRLRIDLRAPTTFNIQQLAQVHAELMLGIVAGVHSPVSLKAIFAHAGGLPGGVAGAAIAMHRQDQHLRQIAPAIAAWLMQANRTYANCPLDPTYFGLTTQQHRTAFDQQAITAAEAQLWQEVGNRIGLGAGTGWIQLPAGCYLSRRGGGVFAVVRNTFAQTLVTILNDPAELQASIGGHHSRAGILG